MATYRKDREEREKRFSSDKKYFRFVYLGTKKIDNGCGMLVAGHFGTLINERLEMKKEQDARANRHWCHTYPAHEFEARTKEQLWEGIGEYIKNYRTPTKGAILTCNGRQYSIPGVTE